MKGWDRFSGRRSNKDPIVSVWENGVFGLNASAVQQFNLTDYKYVVIYYHGERNLVGLLPTNDKNERGTRRVTTQNASSGSINAKAFLRHYRIEGVKGKKFLLKQNEGGMLVADLDSEIPKEVYM